MRILRSIVAPSTAFMAFCESKIAGCSSIRSEIICDELVWDKAIFLQQLAHQFVMRRPGVEAVAERLKTTPKRVSLWSGRFETLGLKGLDDKPGRGRKPSRDRLKVGGVMRHDVAGRASVGREQCGLVRMFRS